MDKIFELIIIGTGPAGLAAAIYAQRARLDFITIEKNMISGGQVLTTYEVDNYPGLPGIGGYDLSMKLREHADYLGAEFVEDEVMSVEVDGKMKRVVCKANTYLSKTILLATGATHRKLGVAGEKELTGMGVSYCATCDGAFFKKKVTAVVGGGDVALEDAVFLSRMCSKVYLIHRRDQLRGSKSLQDQLFSLENVEIIWDTVVEEIKGEHQVESLVLRNAKTEEESELQVQGVFIAVGITPNSQLLSGLVDMEQGYVLAGEDCRTSVDGIFAAGDVRTTPLRQIVTAVADGAKAITSVERFFTED